MPPASPQALNGTPMQWGLKTAAWLTVMVFLTGSAIVLMVHYHLNRSLSAQLQVRGTVLTSQLAASASEALVTKDRLMMTEMVTALAKQDKTILMAALVDIDQRILVSSHSDLEGERYPQPQEDTVWEANAVDVNAVRYRQQPCLDFACRIALDQRIKAKARLLGYAHLLFSLQPIHNLTQRLLIKNILLVMAGCSLSFFLSWFLFSLVYKDQLYYIRVLELITQGHYSEMQESQKSSSRYQAQIQRLQANVEGIIHKRLEEAKDQQRGKMALTIQNQLIPKLPPQLPGIDLGLYFKSGNTVGGDYLDCIKLDDHHWGLVVADIAGQGVGAAVIMSQVRSFLRSVCQYHLSPLKTLVTTNRQLYKEKQENALITMTYAVLDSAKTTLTFCRAGHVGTLIYRRGLSKLEVEKPAGIAMGMAAPESFEAVLVERKIKLLPGDCLLLYTDGIMKKMGQDRSFYSLEKLNVIFSLYASRPAKTILKMIENDMQQYNALEQLDDMGMMLLKLEEAELS